RADRPHPRGARRSHPARRAGAAGDPGRRGRHHRCRRCAGRRHGRGAGGGAAAGGGRGVGDRSRVALRRAAWLPAGDAAARGDRGADAGAGGGVSSDPIPIVIDCDPGHDDAIAIMLALGSPEVELRAVTTVSGNAPLQRTTANAIRVLDHVGRSDVPVAAGADRPLVRDPYPQCELHGESGLDGPDLPPPGRAPLEAHAVDVIAELATASDRPVTLIAIGPLTNVAIFVARHPEAAAALERVVVMGGSIGLGNTTPAAEFNIWGDPEAARRVFTSGLHVTMVALALTPQA